MVSSEAGLAESFEPATGKNIKWVVPLGTQTYSTPVVSGGKVLIGTNNGNARDTRQKGDRGVLMCFNEEDGSLFWQLVVPKLGGDPHRDWPRAGTWAQPKAPHSQPPGRRPGPGAGTISEAGGRQGIGACWR